MTAYYNEFDPFAAQWLRELIAAGHIAPGIVDTRSIVDVRPDELRGYTQCHFFAGIGVWSHALRLAGWADDRPVWTGSCPCQPFSAAGKGGGFDDERHLWPHFHWLISQCRPPVVFGEQVASKDGLAWLDLVQADLEGTGYASGAIDLCAAGVGAPHIRQRLWWIAERLADADRERHAGVDTLLREEAAGRVAGHLPEAAGSGATGWMDDFVGDGRGAGRDDYAGDVGLVSTADIEHGKLGDAVTTGLQERVGFGGLSGRTPGAGVHPDWLADGDGGTGRQGRALDGGRDHRGDAVEGAGSGSRGLSGLGGLADTDGRDACAERQQPGWEQRQQPEDGRALHDGRAGPTNGHWRAADWLFCRDGKWRPVEPGTFPLAHGAAARVGRLRGYGNAIVAQAAAEVVEAYLETRTVDLRLMSDLTTDIGSNEGIFA